MLGNKIDNSDNFDIEKRLKLSKSVYKTARICLFVLFSFSALNIILMILGSNRLLLLTTSFPNYICDLGVYMAEEGEGIWYEVLFAVVALVLNSPYLLIGIFSKRKMKLMPFAVICIFLDCLFYIYLFEQFTLATSMTFSFVLVIIIFVFVIWAGFEAERLCKYDTQRKIKKASKHQKSLHD